MPTVKLDLPDFLEVNVRGAESFRTAIADIPADILARCVAYGWQSIHSDAAAGAAAVAVPAELADKPAEAKAWAKVHPEEVLRVRLELIRESIAEKLAGEWTSRRAAARDPEEVALEAEVYRLIASKAFREADKAGQFAAVYAALDACPKGTPTAERRAAAMAALASLSDAHQKWVRDRAQAILDAKRPPSLDIEV